MDIIYVKDYYLGVARWRATSCANYRPRELSGEVLRTRDAQRAALEGYQGPGMTEGQDRVRVSLDAKFVGPV